MKKIKKTNAYKIYIKKTLSLQKARITLLKMITVVLKRIEGYDRSMKLFERMQKISPQTNKRLEDINKKKQDLEQIFKDYENNQHTILEMFFIADVNAYLIFIQDLMSELFYKTPRLLGDKEIKLYKIIQANNIDSIIKETTELVVAQKMYKDFKQLCKHITKNFKINMYKDSVEFNKIYMRIQIRNLLVHNNGVINKKFIEKTKSSLKRGQKIKMNEKYLNKTSNLLIANVDFISEQNCLI
jgi:hypothetical protein